MFRKLKIVVLTQPINIMNYEQNNLTNEIFSKIIALKKAGYETRHSDTCLPVDTTDFLGTHLIVCEEIATKLVPLMCYKSTTASICEKYQVPFPFLNILKDSGNLTCLKASQEMIQNYLKSNEDISYDTGWTMNPSLNKAIEFRRILKDLGMLLGVKYHAKENIPHWVTFGICKVKTDQFFFSMGGEKISEKPEIFHPGLLNEKAIAIALKDHQYTPYVYERIAKYESLWERRLELNEKDEMKDFLKNVA